MEDITIGNETANIMGGLNNSEDNLKVPESNPVVKPSKKKKDKKKKRDANESEDQHIVSGVMSHNQNDLEM